MIKLGWQGQFEIEVRSGDQVKKTTITNRVMNAALNELAEVLTGAAPDLEVLWLAVGTGGAPVTDSDTQLAAELFRTQPTIDPHRVDVGIVETEFILRDSEAVGSIREIGIFAGSTATAAANTGTMISRVLWSKEKTASEEISIKRIDKVVRA